jgi:hypothetical protein
MVSRPSSVKRSLRDSPEHFVADQSTEEIEASRGSELLAFTIVAYSAATSNATRRGDLSRPRAGAQDPSLGVSPSAEIAFPQMQGGSEAWQATIAKALPQPPTRAAKRSALLAMPVSGTYRRATEGCLFC